MRPDERNQDATVEARPEEPQTTQENTDSATVPGTGSGENKASEQTSGNHSEASRPSNPFTGETLWSEERRRVFFSESGSFGLKLVEQWNRNKYGRMRNVGPLNELCKTMSGSPWEKTPEMLIKYYFSQTQEERDRDLALLDSGDGTTYRQLLEKYSVFGNQVANPPSLRDIILGSYAHSMSEIASLMNQMSAEIASGEIEGATPENAGREVVANLFAYQLFDTAVEGYRRELCVKEWAEALVAGTDITVRDASKYVDTQCGVDLEFVLNGKPIAGIQVKGCAYEKNEHDPRHRSIEIKHRAYLSIYQAHAIVVCVDGHGQREDLWVTHEVERAQSLARFIAEKTEGAVQLRPRSFPLIPRPNAHRNPSQNRETEAHNHNNDHTSQSQHPTRHEAQPRSNSSPPRSDGSSSNRPTQEAQRQNGTRPYIMDALYSSPRVQPQRSHRETSREQPRDTEQQNRDNQSVPPPRRRHEPER